MLESTEIIVQLMRDIINGKMNLQQTKDYMLQLEAKYGDDFFIDYPYEEAKPKPWDEGYLYELEIKSIAGMYSKQFILHLAEVSEYVYLHKSNKNKTPIKSDKFIRPKQLISIATNLENFTKPMRKAYSDIKVLNSSLDKDDKINTEVIQELHSYCVNAIRVYNRLSKICINSAKKNK